MTVATVQRRYCVVTPYYKEERALLERCFGSVRRQIPNVDHIVVADGHPQDWIDALPVRHIKLDRAHGDYGNAARGLGALMAIAEGYDGIAFLDADNWYDDDHLASCLAAAESGQDIATVVAQRRFCRPDASSIAGTPADAPHSEHVDTNCYLFLRGSFAHLHRWCTIPQGLSAYGDQMFGKILRTAKLPTVIVGHRTVNYLCMSESIYQQMGEMPPAGCKPIIRWRDAQAWIHALSPVERRHLEEMTGLTVAQIDPVSASEAVPQPPAPEPAALPSASSEPAQAPSPEPTHIVVEIPGTSLPARLRRTQEDVAAYRRVFLDAVYATADLPTKAGLIVDAAAGLGFAALYFHARYPGATVIAVEPDRETFELLSANMAGRDGCSPVHARIAAQAGPDHEGAKAPYPVLTLSELFGHLDGRTIDLLRLAPGQWQEALAADPDWLGRVRTVLVESPEGVQSIDLAASADALRKVAAEHAQPEPAAEAGRRAIVSFYMANVPDDLVAHQRQVLDRYAPPGYDVLQILTDRRHGDAMDAVMESGDYDTVVFLDIDCVPLNVGAIPALAAHAERGVLAGAAQRANHIPNGGHLYAGAFCMAVNRKLWIRLGCPSFAETTRGDVGEELTWRCEAAGLPVHLLWPSAVEEPLWRLTDDIAFGTNTEYAGAFLHTFGIRFPENCDKFIGRCRRLLAAKEPELV